MGFEKVGTKLTQGHRAQLAGRPPPLRQPEVQHRLAVLPRPCPRLASHPLPLQHNFQLQPQRQHAGSLGLCISCDLLTSLYAAQEPPEPPCFIYAFCCWCSPWAQSLDADVERN